MRIPYREAQRLWECSYYEAKNRVEAGELPEGWLFRKLRTGPPDSADWPIRHKERKALWRRYAGVRKVLVLSDLHSPYAIRGLLDRAVCREADADLAIIGGDGVQADEFASFTRYNPDDFDEEWEDILSVLVDLSSVMDVLFIMGNHERRVLRALMDKMQAPKWFKRRFPSMLDLLVFAAREQSGRDNIHGLFDWFCVIGDAAICHADDFSRIPARTATDVADYLRVNADEMWPDNAINAVVQGHTHHQTTTQYQGVLCIESGCLCWDQDYRRRGKLGPGKKERWQRGYAVLQFDEKGRCLPNGSRHINLDGEYQQIARTVGAR